MQQCPPLSHARATVLRQVIRYIQMAPLVQFTEMSVPAITGTGVFCLRDGALPVIRHRRCDVVRRIRMGQVNTLCRAPFLHLEVPIMHMLYISRRAFIAGTMSLGLSRRVQVAGSQSTGWQFTPPIGHPGEVLGDGFFMRHGFATENTWYNPGWWHTAEDFYVLDGNAAGAGAYAVADGEIVFAGSDYPGLVVIVQHADDLFSMYGHLDYEIPAGTGPVTRGQLLGTVLDRTDGSAPSHLHFEMRTFLTTPDVNGSSPQYGYACGVNCAPGPGYWPIDAPEHPAEMGWLNPTHVLARRAFGDGVIAEDAEVVTASGAGEMAMLWSAPVDDPSAEQVGELPLVAGERYPLLAIETGPEASSETSAEGYRLWYQIATPDVEAAWTQAAVPSDHDTGSDGRPSSVRVDFLPAVLAEE